MRINPLILLLLVSISLNGLFGYLSYKFYSEKGVVQTALISCQESNSSLVKQVEKQREEKQATDVAVADYQQKLQEIQQQQCSIVEKIITINPVRKSDEEANLDDALPHELVSLLKQASDSLQGTSGGDASKSSD